MSHEVTSIRRESFLKYSIQEEEDPDKSPVGGNDHRSSLYIDDFEDVDIDITVKHDNTSLGVSLLDFGDDDDKDEEFAGPSNSFLPKSYHSRDISTDSQDWPTPAPSFAGHRRSTLGSTPPNFGSTAPKFDGNHNRRSSQDSGVPNFAGGSHSRRSSQGSSAPNFAGGGHRRKGSQQRRMMQRLGIKETDSRRASTGTSHCSAQQSFGEMSLHSFTSLNSFSSSMGTATGEQTVQVGNLVFASDEEVATLMYGDNDDPKDTSNTDDKGSDSLVRRSSLMSQCSNLSASLPPSAVLGTGAFSTVRLAWRKTPGDDKQKILDTVETMPVEPPHHDLSQAGEKRQQRRSVVRVKSNTSDVDPNSPLERKGELVAVKIIQKSILKQMKTMQKGPDNRMRVQTAFDNIEREIATMKRLKHPNLVRLFEVIDSVESDRLHMVLEYVSLGEILSHVEGTNQYRRMRYRKKVRGLTKSGHFDEKHAALYFVDIMHGLAYLHRNRICHRDLKPENILLCKSGIAKISDFGVSHMFEDERARESYLVSALDDDSVEDFLSDCDDIDDSMKTDNEKASPTHLTKRESDSALAMGSGHGKGMLKKTEGTWCFWSPEMCSTESKGFSGYACDLWAAGICLYIFTTGTLPFFSFIPSDLFDMIAKEEIEYEGLGLSNELRDLLGKLLTKDASTRAGVGDCLKHKFCADARMERINNLGKKFMDSENHIILSKMDVEMALSVTSGNKQHVPRKISKRFSAPDVSSYMMTDSEPTTHVQNNSNLATLTETSMDNPADITPSNPASATYVQNTSNLTTLTETSLDNSADITPSNPASAAKLKNDSNMTTLTETSVDMKAVNPPDLSSHSAGSQAKKSPAKVSIGLIGSKFKLKNWLKRRH